MTTRVSKWIKLIFAILLLPACFGLARAAVAVIGAATGATHFWIVFGAGVLSWLVVFSLLPKPLWVYVLGHELTHAVWGWIFGSNIHAIKVTHQGGFVRLDRSNFVIALAPYFFPFYSVLITIGYWGGHLIWDWTAHRYWFYLALGSSYAFHATLTFYVLRMRQSDIENEGYLFSSVIIWLGNATVLLVAAPLATQSMTILSAIKISAVEVFRSYQTIVRHLLAW